MKTDKSRRPKEIRQLLTMINGIELAVQAYAAMLSLGGIMPTSEGIVIFLAAWLGARMFEGMIWLCDRIDRYMERRKEKRLVRR